MKYGVFIVRKLLPLKWRGKSCICFGLISLTLQFLFFFILLYIMEEKDNPTRTPNSCSYRFCKDIQSLTMLGLQLGINFIVLDRDFLQSDLRQRRNMTKLKECFYCPLSPLVLGVDSGEYLDKYSQFLRKLIDEDFVLVTFYNRKPVQTITELDQVEVSLFVKRDVTFHIVILHLREDNTWWFGDLHSDPSYEAKLVSLNLTLENIALQNSEGAIERFEVIPSGDEPHLMLPKNVKGVINDIGDSKFLECDVTRAYVFQSQFGTDSSPDAVRFRHKSWKMVSKVKTILNSLNVPFWLSSGTALGYFRECDIIAHSKDVDIGVFASSYSDKIVKAMQNYGFQLKISLGFPNDSLELSFLDQSGLKLDIFFFYEDAQFYWNGGTQVKSGRKFKYRFPKFTLCWTLFKDLRLRVPCEIEAYIKANYGPHWFTPIKSWDWKTSPFNVQPNGAWEIDQLPKAVKVFS